MLINECRGEGGGGGGLDLLAIHREPGMDLAA